MSSNRWWCPLAALALAFAAAGSAPAQEPPEPETDPRPRPPATVPPTPEIDDAELPDGDESSERSFFGVLVTTGAGRDEGFRYGGPDDADLDAERDEDFYLARAALVAYQRPSARTEVTFAYEPELERFGESSELEAVNHSAGLLVDHRLTRRLRWLAGGSFADGEDPSRFLGGLLVVVPRSDFRQTRAFSALERSWRSSTAAIHVGHSATKIAPVENVLDDGVDRSELFGALSFEHAVTPRFAFNGTYSYVDPREPRRLLEPLDPIDDPVDPDEDDPIAPDPDPIEPLFAPEPEPLQAVTVGVTVRPLDGLILLVNGGYADTGVDSTYLAAGEIWREADRYSVRLRYDRALASYDTVPAGAAATPTAPGLQSGVLGSGVTQALTLRAAVRFIDRVSFEQLARSARTELRTGETLDSLTMTSRLVVRVAERFGVFGEFDYFDQDETELAPRLSRQRYAVGLVIGLGGPEGSRGLLVQREHAQRVLPNRGGN
jgi:hypothetical protein